MKQSLPPVSEANPRLRLIEDRLGLNDSLGEFITVRREAGISWNRIAADLSRLTEVYITGEALRLWVARAERAA